MRILNEIVLLQTIFPMGLIHLIIIYSVSFTFFKRVYREQIDAYKFILFYVNKIRSILENNKIKLGFFSYHLHRQ